jgi:RNA polymerase sigma-70 factor (ECF subfamily)
MHKIDNNIISSCITGDRSSQKQLYEYVYRKFAGIIALYVKDDSERDWVFNLGMLKVFNALESYKMGTNFDGFARVILVRSAIDHIRSNEKNKKILELMDFSSTEVNISEFNEVINQIEDESLVRMIQKLQNNERLVFTLFEIEGLSHKEIEEKTSINQNTSKWLLSKARIQLINFWKVENNKVTY